MVASYFEILDEESEAAVGSSPAFVGTYRATEHTVSPWGNSAQHGGPPTALATRAIQRLAAGPENDFVSRVTAEILAPIPVTDLSVRARVVRPGRRVALCEAVLTPVGRAEPVMTVSAWRMRLAGREVPVPATPLPGPPCEGSPKQIPGNWSSGYLNSVEWDWVEGAFDAPGLATVWARPLVRLVADETATPTQNLLVVADSGSGISSMANPEQLLFLNTEVTVHFLRPPTGDRIWMRAETWLDRIGSGLAISTIGDETGTIARGAQSLYVATRDPVTTD